MRAGSASKTAKRKTKGKPRNTLTSKLKIKHNKFTPETKAKRKESLQQWKSSSVPSDVSKSWFQLIMNRYHDYNSRHYHSDKLLAFKINLLEPNVASHLVFAIFFQYYEFDVKDFGYAKNCDAFNKFYIETGMNDQKLLESVLQLLGDPEFNNADIESDVDYFLDLDLAVFGAPPDEYKSFANQLQKEYVHMDENTYKTMRVKILQTFLTIPRIFSTELLRNKFEHIARRNISHEIVELRK